MAKIPQPNNLVDLIDQYHENQYEQQRPYIGASAVGHDCERWIWLQFRYAIKQTFPGRIKRLFRRGHREEEMIVADLRAAGLKVEECLDDQIYLDFGCHMGGHPDGIVSGLPEAPKTVHLAEFKTHNDQSFNDLSNKGVMDSKLQHYVQMQCYMYKRKLTRGLYYAVNKNDDHVYTERVELRKDLAVYYIERGQRIALEEHLPAPLSTKPDWYQCKFCQAYDFCHKENKTTEVNCRTCAHATPQPNSTWHCSRWSETIPTDVQYEGCPSHVLHPDLVPWTLDMGSGLGGPYDGVYIIDGRKVVNGEGGYSSKEILAGGPFNDATLDMIRETFNGKIIGGKS